MRGRLQTLVVRLLRAPKHRHRDPEDVAADLQLLVILEWEKDDEHDLVKALEPELHLRLLTAYLQRLSRRGRRVRLVGDSDRIAAPQASKPDGEDSCHELAAARRTALHALLRVLDPPPTAAQLSVLVRRQADTTWNAIVIGTGWKKRKVRDAYVRLNRRVLALLASLAAARATQRGPAGSSTHRGASQVGWLRHRVHPGDPWPPLQQPRGPEDSCRPRSPPTHPGDL